MSSEADWICPSCNNNNFAFREVCNRCQQPKGAPAVPGYANGATAAPASSGKADWICTSCNNSNYAFRIACNRCRVPREGESMWTCGYCRNENYPNRTECNRCKQSRSIADEALYTQQPAAVAAAAAYPGYGQDAYSYAAYAQPAAAPAVPQDWACLYCQTPNYAKDETCTRCRGPAPTVAPAPVAPLPAVDMYRTAPAMPAPRYGQPPLGYGALPFNPRRPQFTPAPRSLPPMSKPGEWICPKQECRNNNFAFRDVCNRCSEKRPEPAKVNIFNGVLLRPGEWVCGGETCQNINFAFRDHCNRCKAAKPEIPVVTEEASENQRADWYCKAEGCRNLNYYFRTECNRCKKPRKEDNKRTADDTESELGEAKKAKESTEEVTEETKEKEEEKKEEKDKDEVKEEEKEGGEPVTASAAASEEAEKVEATTEGDAPAAVAAEEVKA